MERTPEWHMKNIDTLAKAYRIEATLLRNMATDMECEAYNAAAKEYKDKA